MLKLITSDGFSSAFMAKPHLFFAEAVRGLQKLVLARKTVVSVALFKGLRPWKVGVENKVEAIDEDGEKDLKWRLED